MKKYRKLTALLCAVLSTGMMLMPVQAEEEAAEEADLSQRTGLAALVQPDELVVLSADDVETLNASMESYVPADDTLLVNNAPEFYYYSQIEPIEQEMYDIMLNIARDPVADNIGVMMTDKDPSSDEFYQSFITAFYAMIYDHPELFWLYQGIENQMQYGSEVISQNGIYIVYFNLEHDYDNYETEMTQFNDAANEFLSTIDRNASQYEIARQIHDKLIALVDYNDPVCDNDAEGQNLAHTAYGALVADSYGNANMPVCDGYSQAYIYLLQQCGIEGVLICGDAGDSPLSLGGHAWSIIKLDGYWFEVDSTWDDHDDWIDNFDPYSDGLFIEALSDYDYRNKLDHYLFLVSTATITDYQSDNDYFTYYSWDGSYCCWDLSSVHYRWSGDDFTMNIVQQAVDELIDKAPVAEFTYQL